MQNARLNDHKVELRSLWYHPNIWKQRGTKETLDEGERGEWKVGLKLNIPKTKIMASGIITLWQINEEKWKQWETISLSSKITVDGNCTHEIKRCLLLGRKAITNLDSNIKKQRHCFANKGPSSQSYGFSSSHVWMWELDYKESWGQRTDAFELWCWRRLLRVPGLQVDQTSQS